MPDGRQTTESLNGEPSSQAQPSRCSSDHHFTTADERNNHKNNTNMVVVTDTKWGKKTTLDQVGSKTHTTKGQTVLDGDVNVKWESENDSFQFGVQPERDTRVKLSRETRPTAS